MAVGVGVAVLVEVGEAGGVGVGGTGLGVVVGFGVAETASIWTGVSVERGFSLDLQEIRIRGKIKIRRKRLIMNVLP